MNPPKKSQECVFEGEISLVITRKFPVLSYVSSKNLHVIQDLFFPSNTHFCVVLGKFMTYFCLDEPIRIFIYLMFLNIRVDSSKQK